MNNKKDIIFHLLDLQARDMRIESESEETKEISYESNSDESDDEEFSGKRRYKKAKKPANTQVRELVIHLFGAMENGKTVRCDVTGFRPTMYLRLPDNKITSAIECIKNYIKSQGVPMQHLEFDHVTRKTFYGFTANRPYPFLQISVPSLYLFRMLRGLFLNDLLQPETKKPLDEPLRGKTIEVFEANIDPMLRFLHAQNIAPCGWISIVNGMRSITENSKKGMVIDCEYTQVVPTKGPKPSAPFLTASWDIECFSMTGDFPLAKRTWNKAAKELCGLKGVNMEERIEILVAALTDVDKRPEQGLLITPIYSTLKKKREDTRTRLLSCLEELDIAFSKDTAIEDVERVLGKILRSFVTLEGDPVIQIGTTLTKGLQGSTEGEKHLFVFPDCAEIDGIVIHAYPTEKAMILGWFEWMIQLNPDILLGYNVFGFDESYIWQRAEELYLINGDSPIHEFTRLFELGGEMKLEEKFLSSSAMGDNRMYIWTTQGRLQIDMFHYIKRNFVLPSYKLDEVTKHFMSGKLNSQSYDGVGHVLILELAGAIKDVREGRSIMLLDETGETVTQKLVVTGVDGSRIRFDVELDEDALAEMEDATKWVIVKDDVSPQDIFRLHRGSAEDRAIVGKYCLQDCDLVIDLYKKLEVFNNSMSMANVCTVPVNYIFIRGQGIKIESLIFKYCQERGIVIPVLPVPSKAASGDESYEGAIVLDPQPGFYSLSPIGVCDFASLYPSTIVSENISHDSLLWIKDFTNDGAIIQHQWGSEEFDEHEGYGYTDIEFDIIRPDPTDTRKHPRKIKCGRRICRYAQPLDGTKSTLPQITTWLLTARSAKKKEMKGEKDPERYALLDAEQLAYKLTGNSLYGQLGSGTFKIRLQALAASVTSYGRKQILFAKAAIEKFYGEGAKDPRCAAKCTAKVVYGDSVTGDTFVLVRFRGEEQRVQISTLHLLEKGLEKGSNWIKNDGEKESYELSECYSWTDAGWTRIHRIIRHHVSKRMYRVYTREGFIDVTEDHSLLTEKGEAISPKDLVKGMKLLSTKFIEGDECIDINELTVDDGTVVYDLTTENHHFQAGPEGLIVHNTDSLFVEFSPRNPETGERLEGRDARVATIELTDEAGHFITKALAAPHDFEFDKAFDPLLMFSKKRYAGNMYEQNADEYVHKYMGIALKRRDNAPIVKTIFGGAMKMLLDKRDVIGAFTFVKEKCLELVDGKVSLGQLTVTKSLRADYANPLSIAHKVLADRIKQRDPGNAPAAGDRIGYVYISPMSGQLAAKLQGDRIETPLYIKEHALLPDYRHYIEHQLQNPISQAFALLLEQIPGFHSSILKGCPTAAEDLDKYLAFREIKAAELLFSDCLKRFEMTSRKSAFQAMFKGAVPLKDTFVPEIKKVSSITTAPLLKISTSTKQMTMSSYMLDAELIRQNDTRLRAIKAAKKKEEEKKEEKKEEEKEEKKEKKEEKSEKSEKKQRKTKK